MPPADTAAGDTPSTPLRRLKRKIAAILAADVAGYSRLVAADEERTLRDLAAARVVFDGLVAKGGGRIFNTAGDSVMCEFDSAVEAVRIAVGIQEALAALNATIEPARRLEFRMGLTIGDVVERGGDLLGDGVNLAARLEALAPPGGICVSRSVHEAVSNKIAVAFRDLGPQPVKNFPHPVHAFVIAPAGGTAPSPAPVIDVRPSRDAARTSPAKARGRWRWIAIPAAVAAAAFAARPAYEVVRPAFEAWFPPGERLAEVPVAPPAATAAPAATPVEVVTQPKAAATAAKPPAPRPVRTATAEKPPLPADPAAAFAAIAREGVIPDARTLPELYHNARAHEARGDRAAAQRSYAAAVPMAGDQVDPAWRYAALLRARNADPRKTLADLARNAPSRAAQLLAASLADPAEQRGALETFGGANPDYGPADYLLAEAYLGRPGGPTITDRRLAFDALDRFLDGGARLPPFFIDRAVLEAWLDGARRRRGEIEAFFRGGARPNASFARNESGWLARLTLPEPATAVALRVGERAELAPPAGAAAQREMPGTTAEFSLPAGTVRSTLYVTYRDAAGAEAGPFPIPFDPGAALVAASRDTLERFPESWIQFRTDLPDLISYAQLVTNRCAIGRALIGYGDEPPSVALPLPGCDGGPNAPPAREARSVLALPAGIDSVQVQIAYADGTESPVRRFNRP